MNRNEYLESYKIQVVRRVMSGEPHPYIFEIAGLSTIAEQYRARVQMT